MSKIPQNSLLLLKATGVCRRMAAVRRFAKDSPGIRFACCNGSRMARHMARRTTERTELQSWKCSRLLLRWNEAPKHRLLVTAHFSDGRTEDFSRQALYTSNDKEIAKVDASGLVSPPGVSAKRRFSSGPPAGRHRDGRGYRGRRCRTTRPYPRNNYIDEFIADKLRKFRIVPSELSSDSEFLRRICLDLAGTLPPPGSRA